MKRYIISYYPSSNKIHNIYESIEDAREDVKLCNLFANAKGIEKLGIAEAELTDKEYQEYFERVESEKKER